MSPAPIPRWHQEGDRLLLETPIFTVRATAFRHPARAQAKEFVVIDAADWVVAVALTPAREVVLVRQFRFGSDSVSLELPGGIIDAGEDPVQAAQRELAEETGFRGRSARLLGTLHPNPAIQRNRNHIVLIEHAERTGALGWDPDEELETLVWPVAEAVAAARDGRITHALMVNAVFFLREHLDASAAAGPGV